MSPVIAAAAARGSSPACLVDLETGRNLPISVGGAADGAFDHAVGRRTWVAVNIEYRVFALIDGRTQHDAVALPDAWQIFPAASDNLLLFQPYLGRSGLPGERVSVAVVDADGRMHRQMMLPWGVDARVVGETRRGVVTWAGICAWDGAQEPLPISQADDVLAQLRPVAVLGGHSIVFEAPDQIVVVDEERGTESVLVIPAHERCHRFDTRFSFGASYSACGDWVALGGSPGEALGVVVAGPAGFLRWLPRSVCSDLADGAVCHVWIGSQLMLFNLTATGDAMIYDPASDSLKPHRLAPIEWLQMTPRSDMTGRMTFSN